MLGRQRAHDRPLVDVDRGAQLALGAAGMHRQAVPGVLALGEGQDPVAPVGRWRQCSVTVSPLGST